MTLFGLENKIKEFKKLVKENNLRQSYLFFGESQIGKFTFASCLANFLENKEFALASRPLIDAKIFSPDESGTIGIDAVRELKKFLYQRPLLSSRRTAIFDSAEGLTDEAQNALLKIIEEPPSFSLVIFIGREASAFPMTLASRLTKVYFSRLNQKQMEKFLKENFQVAAAKAVLIAEQSFGRIGRALEIINQKPGAKKPPTEDNVEQYLEGVILSLRKNLIKNSSKLSWLLEREELLKRYNLNQKLQFRAIQEKINGLA